MNNTSEVTMRASSNRCGIEDIHTAIDAIFDPSDPVRTARLQVLARQYVLRTVAAVDLLNRMERLECAINRVHPKDAA